MQVEIEVGAIFEGKVTGITGFGVFVELPGGKSGMVHISEVAPIYVSDINDHVKLGDIVKVKVLSVNEQGKIALSIKRAMDNAPASRPPRPAGPGAFGGNRGGNRNVSSGPPTFEDMMSKFKQTSEDKFSDLKRKNPDARRTKRGSGQ